ncbi:MAG: M14 family zinc carboxypeptidase, partial [Brumimicrobium sp.]
IFCVPMINPDGYIHNETTDPNGGGMHRKNKNPNVGTTNPGVDLNRNYSYQWGTTGVDLGDEDSDVYPGSGPFSEPETQNMKKIAENWNIEFAFNAHTYTGLLLYPIGATSQEFATDHDYFHAYTSHMVKHNDYTAMKSSGLYPASGDSDDYMYKDEGIFAVTPEVGFIGFWPQVNQITDDCIDMLFPNLKLAHLALVYGATEETDPSSTIVDMSGDFNHEIQRLGQQSGQITVSIDPVNGIQSVGNSVDYNLQLEEIETGAISYTLDPGIQYGDEIKYVLKTDNGSWVNTDTIVKKYGDATLQFSDEASNLDNWTGDWDLTTEDYYSPNNSFTDSPNSEYFNEQFSIFNFKDTINLTNATSALTRFRAKWNIEDGYDYVQFQVSTNFGSSWIPQCGKFTNPGVQNWGTPQPVDEPLYDGVQDDWILEEVSLSDYLGEEIMIRFILVSDQGVTEDGFYFDDFELLYDIDDASLTESNLSNFKLIPNPSNDKVQIALTNFVSEGSVSVIDATGKLVNKTEISQQTNSVSLDVSNYNQGIYFVSVTIEGNVSQPQRMVVVH